MRYTYRVTVSTNKGFFIIWNTGIEFLSYDASSFSESSQWTTF